MDLASLVLALIAPLRVGDEILPGFRLAGASTELGVRLRVDAGDERLWVDVGPIESVRRFAARSDRLGFGYRTEGGRSTIDPGAGKRLCEVLAARVAANEAAVLEQLVEAAAAEDDPERRVRRVNVGHALATSGQEIVDHYVINPYVGCVIGCRFCYAQTPIASARALMGLTPYEWGSYVEVHRNLPDVLRAEMATATPLPIKFCPIVGDAYQPTEKKERVTRGCLEAIADAGAPWAPVILTRSTLVTRDLDVLSRIEEPWVGMSLPTLDDEVRRHFEPRAASIAERLDTLDQLRGAGVKTLALVQPMLAGPVEALADAIAEHADTARIGVLAEEEGAEADFDDPRYAKTRDENWQRDRALHLIELLRKREVTIWAQEIPPTRVRGGVQATL